MIPLPGQDPRWHREVLFDVLAYYTGDQYGLAGVVALQGELRDEDCWVAHLEAAHLNARTAERL